MRLKLSSWDSAPHAGCRPIISNTKKFVGGQNHMSSTLTYSTHLSVQRLLLDRSSWILGTTHNKIHFQNSNINFKIIINFTTINNIIIYSKPPNYSFFSNLFTESIIHILMTRLWLRTTSNNHLMEVKLYIFRENHNFDLMTDSFPHTPSYS